MSALGDPGFRRRSPLIGETGFKRRLHDFYQTEPWVTEALCRAVEFDPHLLLWEPACGDGRMARVLGRWHAAVVATDLIDHGYGDTSHDFLNEATSGWLAATRDTPIGAIVTNPPFSLDVPFIERALALTRPAQGIVAMLHRHEFDAPKKNRRLFRGHPAYAVKFILPRRPRWGDDAEDGRGKRKGGRFAYAWYLWDWRWRGEPVTRFLDEPGMRAEGLPA